MTAFTNWIRHLFYLLPIPLRHGVRWLVSAPLDVLDGLRGKRHPMVPPRRLLFTGGGDFLVIGRHYLKLFQELGGVQSHHNVLDIGSGLGRMAVPFTTFLKPEAQYRGIDVMPIGVAWCNERIASKYPNFQFIHVPANNSLYINNQGDPSDYRFPFAEGEFQFSLLTSVFSHMLPNEVAHYLNEIGRVLSPGGRCFFTGFFVSAADGGRLVQNPGFSFPHKYGPHVHVMSLATPHANTALELEWLQDAITAAGLKLVHHKPGYWHTSNPVDGFEFQDVMVVEKT